MAQRLFKSPCEAPPHPRCALIFPDFSVYVFCTFPENPTPVSALLKAGDLSGCGGASNGGLYFHAMWEITEPENER